MAPQLLEPASCTALASRLASSTTRAPSTEQYRGPACQRTLGLLRVARVRPCDSYVTAKRVHHHSSDGLSQLEVAHPDAADRRAGQL